MLETGAIPFDKPSRHRKVRLDDLVEYRGRQRRQAELAFADMIADTERLGLYDANPAEVKAARRKAQKLTGMFSALRPSTVLHGSMPLSRASPNGRLDQIRRGRLRRRAPPNSGCPNAG